MRLTEPNFYLMDEPTNHVDIPGREQLESEILDSEATCLLVSHDRSFVNTIGTRFLLIRGNENAGDRGAGGVLRDGDGEKPPPKPMISIRVRGPIRSSRRRIMRWLHRDAALGRREAGPRQMQEDGAAAAVTIGPRFHAMSITTS